MAEETVYVCRMRRLLMLVTTTVVAMDIRFGPVTGHSPSAHFLPPENYYRGHLPPRGGLALSLG